MFINFHSLCRVSEKNDIDTMLPALRDKLNMIINNHNFLTEEIKEITNVLVVFPCI